MQPCCAPALKKERKSPEHAIGTPQTPLNATLAFLVPESDVK